MADNLSPESLKRKIMVSVLKFFQDELSEGSYDAENSEGLEVAIQCLESIYKVNSNSSDEPSISTVYKQYLRNNILFLPEPSEEDKMEAEKMKILGNNSMSTLHFSEAIQAYTRALQLNPKNAIYYCNRAAAYSRINNHRAAIKDCEMAIEIDGSYSKAYGRLGLAYTGLENYKLAKEYYEMALNLDPKNESYLTNFNQAEKKLSEQNNVHSTMAGSGGGGEGGGGGSSGNQPSLGRPNIDLNTMLNNEPLMRFASQMLTDPAMANTMRNIMTGTFNGEGNMGAILEAGQQLANLITIDNPSFMDELRERISNGGLGGNEAGNGASNSENQSQDPMDQDDSQSANSSQKNPPPNRKRPST